jgi:hypothetical protein
MEIVDLGFVRDWGDTGILSCENFWDSMSKGVKQCHKLVTGCSMRVIPKCFNSPKP